MQVLVRVLFDSAVNIIVADIISHVIIPLNICNRSLGCVRRECYLFLSRTWTEVRYRIVQMSKGFIGAVAMLLEFWISTGKLVHEPNVFLGYRILTYFLLRICKRDSIGNIPWAKSEQGGHVANIRFLTHCWRNDSIWYAPPCTKYD